MRGVEWIQHGVSVNQIVQGLTWSVVDTVRCFSESDSAGIGVAFGGYSTHGVSVNQIVQGLVWSVVDTVRCFSESDSAGIGVECGGYSAVFQ
ncbi:hypothetical protein RRG08_018335 [Elysia crispata]|uniref:Uncharacterized protein n=1 Tax=Elysia crispata TaxID=231223 RepID=A0AAE0XZE1_9GAST|nr:hypothetical protein RRG08_018335 [Elysia crispata]